MIEVSVRTNSKALEDIIFKIPRVIRAMKPDVKRLGKAGYKHLKKSIPISKLAKPHLRDSFKIKTSIINHYSIKLTMYTLVRYAQALNSGATVPERFPLNKKAMVFTVNGIKIFTNRARGFTTRGLHYVESTEAWLARHAPNYIDFSLRKYLT